MIITGIAPSPQALNEKNSFPSGELMYLAHHALGHYRATEVITSLSAGWELALAKSAIELEIPFTVAVPYPSVEEELGAAARADYLDLRSHARGVAHLAESRAPLAELQCDLWRVEQADLVLALWDYAFFGDVYQALDHALDCHKQVSNLWGPWDQLVQMRRLKPLPQVQSQPKRGARVFEREDQ